MSPAVLPAGHRRFEVLQLGRRVVAALAGEAVDPTSHLTMADRYALATLALAVEAEAARRAEVGPMTDELLPLLSADLARIERAGIHTHPEPLLAAG